MSLRLPVGLRRRVLPTIVQRPPTMTISQTYIPAAALALPGYMGKLLRVDLTTGRLWDEPLHPEYARQFIGGSGLGARYLADLAGRDTDPLGPDNPLIFMTGPLVGTTTPAAGRFSVVARSPATGLTGEANSGGFGAGAAPRRLRRHHHHRPGCATAVAGGARGPDSPPARRRGAVGAGHVRHARGDPDGIGRQADTRGQHRLGRAKTRCSSPG